MRSRKLKSFFIAIIICGLAAAGIFYKTRGSNNSDESVQEVTPVRDAIQMVISSTGTVLPKNRLEIKPPVNGRIEEILVQEGDKVKAGQLLAWMSSTERAALLDAARGKGQDTLAYWQEAYKPIPLSAPIDGEVIVSTTQPGQTVSTTDAVIVLSDQLIVRAQVDETDIGKISMNKHAVITLDAYPDTKINAYVEHIYYESETVNNVTVYKVDLKLKSLPGFFRSGMNANVDFIEESKGNALLIPEEAVAREIDGDYVLVKQPDDKEPLRVRVDLGISDGRNIEVLSGVSEKDRIVIKGKKYRLPKDDTGTNPFMPNRRR